MGHRKYASTPYVLLPAPNYPSESKKTECHTWHFINRKALPFHGTSFDSMGVPKEGVGIQFLSTLLSPPKSPIATLTL